ncbi:phenol hydroxylase [Diaphorobacter sp. HDW4A]|uniref:phenol hydroxylase n=1 Tax=Diaphorobacter sp. HDW4A TaxID=2714924 RepID=UPI00140AE9C6|nr:phenol hydroxylase [Diaphorobacter sp. HDW4A]QIL78788.1 phenol hydroxylase [Diaphorobacter sp. HDW4A]
MNIELQAREIQPQRQTFARVAAHTGDKPASRYLEAMLGAQPAEHFHYKPTWEQGFELYDKRRTAIVMNDWYALRDPRQFYYASWTMARARQQDAMEANYQFVESRQLAQKMSDALRAQVCTVLLPLRHVAFGGNMNNCQICSRGYGTAFTAPAMFHAMDQLGVAQYLTRLGLTLEEPGALEAGRNDWLQVKAWQPLRQYVEDSLVVLDPVELFIAQNLALDGLLYPLLFTQYVDDHLAVKGGTAVAMLTNFIPEWHTESARWIDAVVKVAAAESEHNRTLLSGWYSRYVERAASALAPIAALALGDDAERALADVKTALEARARKAGLDV